MAAAGRRDIKIELSRIAQLVGFLLGLRGLDLGIVQHGLAPYHTF
jgi:hypothetical protein